MNNVKLVIDGRDFAIHCELLKAIAEDLPSNGSYTALADALLGLGFKSVTNAILERDDVNIKELDKLWDSGHLELRRALCSTPRFLRHLSDRQAEDILKLDDGECLIRIAKDSDAFYDPDASSHSPRLSEKLGEELLNFLRDNANVSVRRALARASGTSEKFYPSLEEAVKFDAEHCKYRDITAAEARFLDDASIDLLEQVANYVERIADANAREAVINWFLRCNDPCARLKLAENSDAPGEALMALANDADEDVARAARRSLKRAEY